jgi:sugar lactone lactonase YvrE
MAEVAANRVLGQFDFTHNGVNIVSNAGLWTPQAVAVDRSVIPNRLYVADAGNHRVLGWHSISALNNGSPADLVIGQPDFLSWGSQCNNAAVTGATLCFPSRVAVDAAGNLYVVDQGNNRVLEYDDPFNTDTQPDMVFGQGGSFTSTACNKGGTITAGTLCNPAGVAVDNVGNLFISDNGNSRVLEYNLPLASDDQADVVFGQFGLFNSGKCNLGGVSANSLCNPQAVAVDQLGNLYVEDSGNFRALEYNAPFANTTADLVFGQSNDFTSNTNPCPSPPVAAVLCSPGGLALDNGGNLYISDSSFSRIQAYSFPARTGNTEPVAVVGQPNFNSGLCDNGGVDGATVCLPGGMATDDDNDLFVADFGNQRVLKYLNPLATNPPNTQASLVLGQGALDRNGINGTKPNSLGSPRAVALDFSVTPNRLYVADTGNNRVLGWHSVAAFSNGAPADLVIGQKDFFSAGCNQNRTDSQGNSLPAADTLCAPGGLAVDSAGDLWVADSGNFRVLQYNPPFASGLTTDQSAVVVLGQQGSFTTRIENNGGVSARSMAAPAGLAVDAADALYVADPDNNRVLKYNNPRAFNPIADTVFGQGGSFSTNLCNYNSGCHTQGCLATASALCGPAAVAVNVAGNVYIADTLNNRALQYPPGASGNPVANVVVGQKNFSAPSCTTLCQPQGLGLDAAGNLYVTDGLASEIKEFDAPLVNNAPVNLVIGIKLCGQAQSLADTMCGVVGLGFDATGNLYAADTFDDRVLVFNRPAVPTPTPTPSATPTPSRTPAPTATATPGPGVPFISALPPTIHTGAQFKIDGSGFTNGSRVNFFVSTSDGAINAGPLTPSAFSPAQLTVPVPAAVPLGQGVVAVEVVNTDKSYTVSNVVLTLLQGNPAMGIPSLVGVNSAPISPDSVSAGVATANVQTVVVQGSTVTLNGAGFDAVNGVAVDLFCACPGGRVPAFFINPSLELSSTQIVFDLPSSGPQAPATGPGSFVVHNKGAAGTYSMMSNALSVPIGQQISVTAVGQSGTEVMVFGTGFSTLTVINLFNVQGAVTVNLGGLNASGKPKIPLTLVDAQEVTFTVPAAAVPGAAYVQALNPPFVPFTSSGNAAGGAFTLK